MAYGMVWYFSFPGILCGHHTSYISVEDGVLTAKMGSVRGRGRGSPLPHRWAGSNYTPSTTANMTGMTSDIAVGLSAWTGPPSTTQEGNERERERLLFI